MIALSFRGSQPGRNEPGDRRRSTHAPPYHFDERKRQRRHRRQRAVPQHPSCNRRPSRSTSPVKTTAAESRSRCGRGERSPGADVGGVSQVLAQMWQHGPPVHPRPAPPQIPPRSRRGSCAAPARRACPLRSLEKLQLLGAAEPVVRRIERHLARLELLDHTCG